MDIELSWHLVGQIAGWVAAALTLTAFTMRTMVPLRLAALGANVFFVVYGLSGAYWQVLVLHAVLLPFNLYRLLEIRRRIRDLKRDRTGGRALPITAEMIAPYAGRTGIAAGQTIFRKGERADKLYMIVAGKVRIAEIDVVLGRGDIFGEIAFFAPDRSRTDTAMALVDTDVLALDEAALIRLTTTSPVFGVRLMELITARLIERADDRRDADGQDRDGRAEDRRAEDRRAEEGRAEDGKAQGGQARGGGAEDGRVQDGQAQDGKPQDGPAQQERTDGHRDARPALQSARTPGTVTGRDAPPRGQGPTDR